MKISAEELREAEDKVKLLLSKLTVEELRNILNLKNEAAVVEELKRREK